MPERGAARWAGFVVPAYSPFGKRFGWKLRHQSSDEPLAWSSALDENTALRERGLLRPPAEAQLEWKNPL